jgi:hypothetical protein
MGKNVSPMNIPYDGSQRTVMVKSTQISAPISHRIETPSVGDWGKIRGRRTLLQTCEQS